MRQVFLTFDTEDFISENSISSLRSLLLCLRKHSFKAIFFVTGHMAEKLKGQNETIRLLEEHEIGYHSSSHSVHPTIFEFTDVENYEEAYKNALLRETSHINPLNGRIEGPGGIFSVRSLCSDREIRAYRAPGFCWSPPHSEALRDLGLRFDFSSKIAPIPIFYKGLTFYPYPTLLEWQGRPQEYRTFLSSALRRKFTVMGLHPSLFVNQDDWDAIYKKGNPDQIPPPHPRTSSEFKSRMQSLNLFLEQARRVERTGLIKVTSDLKNADANLTVSRKQVEDIFEFSMRWPRRVFKYEPRYLRNHFLKFFAM